MIKSEILEHANIPESWWADCYIDGNDMIFTPRFSENNVMIATGIEVYQEFINQKPITPAPNTIDTLQNSLLAAQQTITDQDLALIAAQQAITDNDLRLLALEEGQAV